MSVYNDRCKARGFPRTSWSSKEPGVTTWVNAGCDKHQYTFPPKNLNIYDLNTYHHANGRHPVPHSNFIASMDVPPHMSVTGFSAPGYNSDGWKNHTGKATWGPGTHSNLSDPKRQDPGYNTIGRRNTSLGNRDIDSMKITKRKSWPEFLRDCCQRKGETAANCKNYYGPNQGACQSNMNFHCGINIGWHKSAICKEWGAAHKNQYDALAAKVCRGSKDLYCACFNPADPGDIQPACFDVKCSSGGGPYQTAIMKNQAGKCPTYCMQKIIATADKNVIIEGNEFNQQCGPQVKAHNDKIKEKEDADAKDKEEAEANADPISGNAGSGGGLGAPGSGRSGSLFGSSTDGDDGDDATSSKKKKTALAVGGGGLGLSISCICCVIILAIIMYMMM
jgi:hypothetical protein